MYRNLLNRWWTIALACALGLAFLVSLPAQALAGSGAAPIGGTNPGLPPEPGPNASGDPDTPQGTGRSAPSAGRGNTIGSMHQAPTGPVEMRTTGNVWLIKVRFALQMVRVFYLHD